MVASVECHSDQGQSNSDSDQGHSKRQCDGYMAPAAAVAVSFFRRRLWLILVTVSHYVYSDRYVKTIFASLCTRFIVNYALLAENIERLLKFLDFCPYLIFC